MANSTNIIGKVVGLQGQAIVKSPDGKQHALKIGDVVYENDIIVTAPGAQVELAFDAGHNYLVRQNETLTLDASVYAPTQVEVANAALLPDTTADANAKATDLNKAIAGQSSLDQLLEETAAGLSGGDVGEGNNFVRLDRIAESVTPLAFNATASGASTVVQQDPASAPTEGVSVTSVSAASTIEGGLQEFVVRLSGQGFAPILLNLALQSGSAQVGVDTTTQMVSVDGGATFVPLNGSVLVPAGVDSVIVRVTTIKDGILEGTEALSLVASTSNNPTAVSGTGSILDTAVPIASITGPVDVNEASGTVTFTVSLNETSPASITINYTTSNGTAVAGSDFTPVVGSVVFAPGESSKTITIPITNDTVFEGGENFAINLTNPSNVVIGSGTAVTIIKDDGTGTGGTNDDRPVVASISPATVGEGGRLVFTVNLNVASGTATTVNVSASSGSANVGVDTAAQEVSLDGGATWTSLSGSVSVPAGATSFLVRVATVNDGVLEGNETIQLSAATALNKAPLVGVGTISDGAIPGVSISGPSDVNEATGTVSYTVTLSAASAAQVSVNYNTSNGSATAGSDFTAATGTVVFAPGETSKTIQVGVTNDAVFEGNESFQVNLSNATNATIATSSSTTTVHDDGTGAGGTNDDRVRVTSVSSPTVGEGGNLVFTVSLSGTSTSATSVNVAAQSGTASLGQDTGAQEYSTDGGATWKALSGAVSVPAGASSFQVRIASIADGIIEGSESLSLSASTANNATPVTGTGTITDGAVPTISLSGPAEVNEAAGTVTYTVSLSSASAAAISVSYASANGSAIAGSDYAVAAGNLTFAPGETSKTITVAITNDTVFEGAENFSLSLSNPANATIANGTVTTAIKDDGTGTGGDNDDRLVVSSVSSPTVGEGGALIFTVSLNGSSTTATSVNVTPSSGTAILGSDTGAQEFSTDGGVTWTALSGGAVNVPAGQSSFQVRIATVSDGVVEGSETITLSASTAQNASPVTGTGTITDGAVPTISISGPAEVNEAAGTLTYTVSLSTASVAAISVNYATANGSATAGSDYTTSSGSLSFAPGETTKTITVAINNDAVFEGSENFSVNLSAASNATIATGTATTTIKDDGTGSGGSDDDRLTVTTVSSPSAAEGNALVFTVTLSGTSTTATNVNVTPSSGSATLGTDTGAQEFSTDGGLTWNALVGGTVSVPAGQNSFQLRVATVNDGLIEGNENITLAASTAQNASAVTGTGTITDGAVPTISISGPADVNEAAGTISYTISLSAASVANVSVNYASTNGTALAGSDFTASSGSVTFAPGETSKTVTVAITNDSVFEGSENFTLNLNTPTNATIATGSVTTNIKDDGTGTGGSDDDRLTVTSVSSPTVGEGGNLDFTVNLSNTSITATTVNVSLASGTATLGTDTGTQQYSVDGGVTWSNLTGGTVSVPAGQNSFRVRVATTADGIIEASESFTLGASTAQNASAVTGTGTITDGAVPTISISGPADINEAAGTATYTVSLSTASVANISVNYATADGTATAGSDYTLASGSLTFNPGETTKTITVPISNDSVFEGSESFTVNLSSPTNATLATASVTTAIKDDGTGSGGSDDDRLIVTTVSNASAAEGGSLTFTVSLSATSTTATNVSVNLISGSASLGTDTGTQQYSTDGGTTWLALSGGTVSVPAGLSSFQVRVASTIDGVIEGNESFSLAASTAQNASVVTGTGTIIDAAVPVIHLSGPADIDEAAGTATYTVSLSATSVASISVNYATTNGTALAGSDYTVSSGSITFAPGESSKTFTVPITNDNVFEGSENFTVNLSTPSNATIGTGSVTSNIKDDGTAGGDDDRLTVVSVSNPSTGEGNNLVFTITLSGTSTTATTVNVTPSSGSATLGTDTGTQEYSTDGGITWSTLTGGTVSVPAGKNNFQVRIATLNDAQVETTETVNLSAATAQNSAAVSNVGQITDSTLTVTIPNDGTGTGGSDQSVAENATVTGSFAFTAPDGLTSLTIAGSAISAAALAAATAGSPITIVGSKGTLSITSYTGTSTGGTVSYSYDPTGTSTTHPASGNVIDNFSVVVTDPQGDTNGSASLDILITDTNPTANADSRTVTEDASAGAGITGNVVTGVNATADTLGADSPTNITGVQAGSTTSEISSGVGSAITGTYGTLTLQANGSYTYISNAAAQALNVGDTGVDTFSYTLKDNDGDVSTTTITINVTGLAEITVAGVTSDDDDVEENRDAASGNDITHAGVISNVAAGVVLSIDDTLASGLTSNGQTVTYAWNAGTRTLTASTASSGTVFTVVVNAGNDGYVFKQVRPLDHAVLAGENHSLNIPLSLVAKDTSGNQLSTTALNVTVFDDAPTVSGNLAIVTDNDGAFLQTAFLSQAVVSNDVTTVTWNTAGLPSLVYEGKPVIYVDNGSGTLTGQIADGTLVFRARIDTSDLDATNHPKYTFELLNTLGRLGIEGSSNTYTVISGGNVDQVDLNFGGYLIDSMVAYNSSGAVSTVNTNNNWIGVGGNWFDAGEKLAMTFKDPNGNPGQVRGLNLTVEGQGSAAYSLVWTVTVAIDTAGNTSTYSGTVNGTGNADVPFSIPLQNGALYFTKVEISDPVGSSGTFRFNFAAVTANNYFTDLNLPLSYTLKDYDQDTASGNIDVTLKAPTTTINSAPIAADDTYTLVEDSGSVTLNPLAGDTDPEGSTLTIQSINGVALTPGVAQSISVTGGTVNITSANVISFTPNANFNGAINFPYVISDGSKTGNAREIININAVNDVPVAVADTDAVTEDGSINRSAVAGVIQGTGTDTDPDNPSVSLNVSGVVAGTGTVTQGVGVATSIAGTYGHLTLNADGSYTYLADMAAADSLATGVTANDVFTYTVKDPGNAVSNTTTLTIAVTGTNDAPVAVADSASTTINTSLNNINVKGNDTDVDNTNAQLTISNPVLVDPTKGTVTLNPDGTLNFTPANNVTGNVVIQYTVSDPGALSSTGTLTVNVGSNTLPTGADITKSTPEDTALTLVASDFGFSDADAGQSLNAVRIDTLPAAGSLTLNGVPVTAGQVISAANITANQLVFTPALNANGNNYGNFTFSVQDSAGGFDAAPNNVTLNVTPVNDAPTTSAVTLTAIAEDSGARLITQAQLLINANDIEGNSLTASNLVITAGSGTLVNNGNGTWSYTPALNDDTNVSFSYSITDNGTTNGAADPKSVAATATLDITPVNDAPVDGNETNTVTEDTTLTVANGAAGDLLNNATDVDGGSLAVASYTIAGVAGTQAVGAPVAIAGVGSVTINANGSYGFTPIANYTGAIPVITYTVSDGNGGTDTSTLTLSMTPVNDAPVLDLDANNSTTTGANYVRTYLEQATPVSIADTDISITDLDNSAISGATITLTNQQTGDVLAAGSMPAGITANVSGNSVILSGSASLASYQTAIRAITFANMSDAPNTTPRTIEISVHDGSIGSNLATTTINVTAVNDAPSLANSSRNVSEEGLIGANADTSGVSDTTNAATTTGSMVVTDADSTSFTYSLTSAPSGLTSNALPITWTLSGQTYTGSTSAGVVATMTINNTGTYSFTLSKPIDHATANQEDVRALNFGVSVSDGSNSSAATVTINVEDDSPTAQAYTNSLNIRVDSLSVNSLTAGFLNATYTGSNPNGAGSNTDADSYSDRLRWGNATSGSSRSGYDLVENSSFASTAGQAINTGVEFRLGDFTHVNFPVTGGSLNYTDIIERMNVVINGVSNTISFTVRITHQETTNTSDPIASRDIITLPSATTSVVINGQNYQVNLLGFKDTGGTIVNTIYTDESANNTYGVFASVESTVTLPVLSGTVVASAGADGSNGIYTWSNVSSTYGTFVGNADGTYQFTVNRATYDSFTPGKVLTQSFTYTYTDRDGDTVTQTVTINLNGVSSPAPAPAPAPMLMQEDALALDNAVQADKVESNNKINLDQNDGDLIPVSKSLGLIDHLQAEFAWNLASNDPVGSTANMPTDDQYSQYESRLNALNLKELITIESDTTLDQYVHFDYDDKSGDTTLYVSKTGAFDTNSQVGGIPDYLENADVYKHVFHGQNLTAGFTTDLALINDLITKGKLITD